jgi:N-acetylglutamate synthase-like GNAT family acetyltransferase
MSVLVNESDLGVYLVCCLAGVYVPPTWRRRGIGYMLCRRAVLEAERLRLPSLGLFTHDGENFYAKMGWKRAMDAAPPNTGVYKLVAFMELQIASLRTKHS